MPIIIDISNHPALPNVRRKARYDSFTVSDTHRLLILKVVVSHFDEAMQPLSGTIPDRTVQLVANETTRVDANGDVVKRFVLDAEGKPIKGEDGRRQVSPGWDAAKPQWDHFDEMAKAGPVNIYAVIRDIMVRRSAQGYFDRIY